MSYAMDVDLGGPTAEGQPPIAAAPSDLGPPRAAAGKPLEKSKPLAGLASGKGFNLAKDGAVDTMQT